MLFHMTQPYMERLDDDQTEAVLFGPEPLLVMAGAGSGKTSLLTARIAHMIDTGLVAPDKMFVSAFTRAAANEMKERVELLTDCSGLEIGTFHSIMFRLLNRERTAAGLENWNLCKSGRQKMWFQKMLERPSRDYPNALGLACDIGNVMGRIGDWKNACIHSYDPAVKETLEEAPYGSDMFASATLYPLYEEWLASEDMIDFDDMLLKSYDLLCSDDEILARARDSWTAFFVDECQDTNLVQFKLIELLAPPETSPNITLVGDTRQALYEFRGARPELLEWFQDRWKATRLDLANNYRSVSTVVTAANRLVNGIMDVIDQKSIRGAGVEPEAFAFSDEFDQALAIAQDVTEKREAGKQGGDVAVLVRTNAQSAAIESAFVKAQLPYWCNGGGFFEHMEIGDLVAYLRLTQDRTNTEALHRIINRPTRFLGKAFVEAVEANAPRYDGDLVKSMRFTDSYSNRKLSAKQRAAAFELVDLIESLTEHDGEEIYPGQAVLKVLNSTNYIEWLKQNTGMGEGADESRLENIDALKRVCGEHSSIKSLLHFIDESSRLQQDSGDATQILTVHRSKGGEWDTVWVANMHDDSFPHKAAQIEGNIMPERRIAYVAFTRAKNELKLAVPAVNEKGVQVSPSRFIAQAGIERPDDSTLVEI
jgi:DNA helicase-2/ATP-dependent DNA helicase PcrA